MTYTSPCIPFLQKYEILVGCLWNDVAFVTVIITILFLIGIWAYLKKNRSESPKKGKQKSTENWKKVLDSAIISIIIIIAIIFIFLFLVKIMNE